MNYRHTEDEDQHITLKTINSNKIKFNISSFIEKNITADPINPITG